MHGGELRLIVMSVEEHLQSFMKRKRRGDGQEVAASFKPAHS